VQVILQIYDTLAAVLLNFDVDCCCFGFRPGESHVCDADFSSLRFVVDAVRTPETSAKFKQLYGIPRLLKFERAIGRPSVPVDFWCGIYE